MGYSEYLKFSWALIRWFDYYDWVIFEMFDNNKDNPRALFGGWRYNWLSSIFWVKEEIPAVWMAPGDETMKIFLEGWWLFENMKDEAETIYFPLLEEKLFLDSQALANKLRKSGKNVLFSLNIKKLQKAFKYAEKNNIENVIIFWENELNSGEYILKNLKTSEEKIFKI